MTYRVRKKAYKNKIGYPSGEGEAEVLKLISSPGHTAPMAKIKLNNEIKFVPSVNGLYEGQKIEVGKGKVEKGNVLKTKDIPSGTRVFNIELRAGDGGKLVRSGGSFATITKKENGNTGILLPSKKEIFVDENCRVTIGEVSGHGRLQKPVLKAGKKFYIMKGKGKLWPRTSAVKMNAVDHPLGSGRGKNPAHGGKGKTPKRDAPPGAKVGSLRPKRTGRKKK